MALPSALLRFQDLKIVGINNWPTLKRRIENDGFPVGRYAGSLRFWTEEEVANWWDSRPPGKAKPTAPAGNKGDGSGEINKPHLDIESDVPAQALHNHEGGER